MILHDKLYLRLIVTISCFAIPFLFISGFNAKESISDKHMIQGVPFVMQKPYYCGPASFEMVLGYYGYVVSQDDIKKADFENETGTNYHKMQWWLWKEKKIKSNALTGNLALIKKFILEDTPVIVRQWTTLKRKGTHYRVVVGYDDINKIIFCHDPRKGPNISLSYDKFIQLWNISDSFAGKNLMIVLLINKPNSGGHN